MASPEPYAFLACCDFSGLVRGKGFSARRLVPGAQVGWTPTNIMINAFGRIPATPWGAAGDLVLAADGGACFPLDFGDEGPVDQLVLCDIRDLAGRPWDCCPRACLAAAVDALAQRQGVRLRVAFEHEFHLSGLTAGPGAAYGLEAVRSAGAFPGRLLASLEAAALAPETFLPEYGPGQFEVTVEPELSLPAADRAVAVREVVRGLARRMGLAASFSPVVTPGIVGNGVHVHFSLEDLDGRPLSHDPARPHGVSERAGRFLAGVLRHAPALCAVCAPSALSYERLKPNSWSTHLANLGWRDREAFVRICPVSDAPGADVARAFNFELRVPDGAASPYLVLGALIRAGLAGLDEALAPAATQTPGAALPGGLEAALTALEHDTVLMPPAMKAPYLMLKRGEIAHVANLALEERVALYARIY